MSVENRTLSKHNHSQDERVTFGIFTISSEEWFAHKSDLRHVTNRQCFYILEPQKRGIGEPYDICPH